MVLNSKSVGVQPPQHTIKMPALQQDFITKMQPKLFEVASKHVKLVAKWFHTEFSWKVFLMVWMVVMIMSKMVILAITYQFFTLINLLSLQIFHGVWVIAFVCLILLRAKSLVPEVSCLLAGYLPIATLLHILLIPRDFPLPYVISDASTTLVSILIMFFLLRMECGQILAKTDQLLQQPPSHSRKPESPPSVPTCGSQNLQIQRLVVAPIQETVACPQYQQHPSMDERERREIDSNSSGYEETFDLEPIDFEYFMEEPDLDKYPHTEVFRVPYVGPCQVKMGTPL